MPAFLRHAATIALLALIPFTHNIAYAADNKKSTEKPTESQLPLEELRTFSLVLEQIRAAYVEDVDDKTLLENATRGMLSELDPHSAYLDESDFNDLKSLTTGEFGGLGIEIGAADGFIKIITPLDDTPASRAGIQAGDIIVKIGSQSVQGMSMDDAINLMRGEIGTAVKLTIMRNSQEQPLEFNLVREMIKVHSVRGKMLEPAYAYIRIAQFQADTTEELNQTLSTLKKQQPLKGIILDLRNNPGGLLQEAVGVSDTFLDKGLIVYTKGRIPSSNTRYSASYGDVLVGAPIVVLVNQGTASAAEIVAGALQDNHRAKILGTNTFGKGTVQTVIPISETKAIKLTTAMYYTPSGRSIQAEGIKPDVVDADNNITAAQSSALTTEASLERHLANGNAAPSNTTPQKKTDAEKNIHNDNTNTASNSTAQKTDKTDGTTPTDNQLQDALKLLKTLAARK
jgi:carboxyl-terminal processing protease